jgi:hypothetical protein
MPILLNASIGETIVTVIFGLLGFVVVIFLLIYLKAFLSKVANIRYVDRQGKTKIDTDTFDNINEMIGDKVSSLTTSIKKNYSQTISAEEHSNVIKPKIGVGGFYLGDSISKSINELGNNYNLVEHGTHSIEYQFPIQGICLYVKYEDIKKRVFWIKILQPCKAKTSKGMFLGSKLREVIKSYGKPEYTSTQFGDIWSANFKGISFDFIRDKNIPKYPFNETAHLNSDIIQISISK